MIVELEKGFSFRFTSTQNQNVRPLNFLDYESTRHYGETETNPKKLFTRKKGFFTDSIWYFSVR